MPSKPRIVYARSRGGGGLSSGWGWLKSAGIVLGVMIPLIIGASKWIQQNTENAILHSQASITTAQAEFNTKLASLKESVDRAAGQVQLDLVGFRQALREHGEAIAEIKAEQRMRTERR
jgi:hypothetical protein